MGGDCGYRSTYHVGFGHHTAAVSSALFWDGEACGGCYHVKCNYLSDPKWCRKHRLVTVTATNVCDQNKNGGWCNPPRHHFDMSMLAFLSIARQGNEGTVPHFYRRVKCSRGGEVRFTMMGPANLTMVMISNVGGIGEVKTAWISGLALRTWMPMHRNRPAASWESSADLRWEKLSFKLTLIDGETRAFLDVVPSDWMYKQSFSSRYNFF